jgi:hypothetical protein
MSYCVKRELWDTSNPIQTIVCYNIYNHGITYHTDEEDPMILEKTAYRTTPIHQDQRFNGSADVQALARSLNTAHEKGALFFLAVQLAPLLEEHYEKYGAITPLDLETLIAQTNKTMLCK